MLGHSKFRHRFDMTARPRLSASATPSVWDMTAGRGCRSIRGIAMACAVSPLCLMVLSSRRETGADVRGTQRAAANFVCFNWEQASLRGLAFFRRGRTLVTVDGDNLLSHCAGLLQSMPTVVSREVISIRLPYCTAGW